MIRFFHVSKSFGRDDHALIDVSLRLKKGEFAFLTGHSGAGKSTLMKLIFAAESATEGHVVVDGHDLSHLKPRAVPQLRRSIGVVFQDFRLLPQKNVFENVAFVLEMLGAPKGLIRDRVRQTLREVGLEHKMKSLPTRLSGGEQQRVAIARALVGEPKLILADEPTGNLDPEMAVDVMQLFENCNARGTTVLVATHSTELVSRFRKRVIRLDQGRLVSEKGT